MISNWTWFIHIISSWILTIIYLHLYINLLLKTNGAKKQISNLEEMSVDHWGVEWKFSMVFTVSGICRQIAVALRNTYHILQPTSTLTLKSEVDTTQTNHRFLLLLLSECHRDAHRLTLHGVLAGVNKI